MLGMSSARHVQFKPACRTRGRSRWSALSQAAGRGQWHCQTGTVSPLSLFPPRWDFPSDRLCFHNTVVQHPTRFGPRPRLPLSRSFPASSILSLSPPLPISGMHSFCPASTSPSEAPTRTGRRRDRDTAEHSGPPLGSGRCGAKRTNRIRSPLGWKSRVLVHSEDSYAGSVLCTPLLTPPQAIGAWAPPRFAALPAASLASDCHTL